MARLFVLLVLLAGLGPAASAQWVQTEGPIGADFRQSVALSETEVLAATWNGIVFLFDGSEWSRQPEVTLPQRQLHRHGDLWYQLVDGAVLVSSDHGRTWTDAGAPAEVRSVYAGTEAFYAATLETVYATTDGATWSTFVPSLVVEIPAGGSTTTGLLNMSSFFVHDGLFMARGHVSGHVGLFRTEDGGQTWSFVFPAPTPDDFFAWGDAIYGYGCHSYRSFDRGLTWEFIEQPRVDGATACFDYLAEADGALLAQAGINSVGTRFGVFRLDGDTWERVRPSALGLSVVGDAAFVVDEGGIYRSTDGGTTWEALPVDLIATTVVPYTLSDGAALVLSGQGFVHRSEDLVTWSEPAPITPAGLRASVLLVHGDAVLAGTEDGIFRSTDGGLTWVASNTGIEFHPFHLDRTPRFATNGEVILAGHSFGFAQQGHGGTSFGGMHRSDDGGQTWTSMDATFPRDAQGRSARVYAVAMSGSAIVASTFEGNFVSADEGQTWVPTIGLPNGLMGVARSIYAFGENFYFITIYGQLFESTDGGLTWHFRRQGIPEAQFFHDAHLFQIEDQIFLVVNKDGTGVGYRLAEEWEQIELEMPLGVRFNGFAVQGDVVLAGTIDAGAWTAPTKAFFGTTVASEATVATRFEVSSIYPNPTAGASRLTLTLGQAQPVRVEVLDVLGRRAVLLHDGPLAASVHAFTLPAQALPAGSYLVRVAGQDFAEVRRLTVVR